MLCRHMHVPQGSHFSTEYPRWTKILLPVCCLEQNYNNQVQLSGLLPVNLQNSDLGQLSKMRSRDRAWFDSCQSRANF